LIRTVRVFATLAITGLCVAYILWKIDVGRTAHVIAHARVAWLVGSVAIMAGSVWPMAWRWQRLLAARGVHESFGRLVRTYFVGYAAGQLLPTALGGDASRIYETTRRHEGAGGAAAGTVLLERALGAAATLVLAAGGFALAVGRYNVGGYLWVELAFVVVTAALGLVLFSRRIAARAHPLLRVRIVQNVYTAMHSFRDEAGLLWAMFALTLVVQAARVLAIWFAAKAVGVDLSPRPYYVMGPLLFLVALVPFTVNGFAVRESFFVSFLGQLGVPADRAFSAGFLYFAVTLAVSLPGAGIVAWEAVRRR
jgi:uncharacterized protein (TIRG00374 family)